MNQLQSKVLSLIRRRDRAITLARLCAPERGFALITVLMLVVLMTALVTGFLMSTSLETKLAFTGHDRITSVYLSETGLAWALNRIRFGNWLDDYDINSNNVLQQSVCSSAGWIPKDIVGYYLHDANSEFDEPPEVWDYRYNDVWTDDINDIGCQELNELPIDSAFRVWAYQDVEQLGTNKWSLVSLGYRGNLTYGSKITFKTLNPLLKCAVAGDRYVAMHARWNAGGPTGYVYGTVWSNGELEVSRDIKITCDLDGLDNVIGRNPATGDFDDEFIAALGHVTFGGTTNGDIYTSSMDTYQPDGDGLDNKEFYKQETPHPGPIPTPAVSGTLHLRNAWEKRPSFYEFDYSLGYYKNLYRYAQISFGEQPTNRSNPICRETGDQRKYVMDFLSSVECVATAIPTNTPTPGIPPTVEVTTTVTVTPTPTITSKEAEREETATPLPTFTPFGTQSPTQTPIPTLTPTWVQKEWYAQGTYYLYVGIAEQDCGTSDAPFVPAPIGGGVASPYGNLPCYSVTTDTTYVAVTPNPADPREFFKEPPESKFLFKREFGPALQQSTINFDLYRRRAFESPETQRSEATYFANWEAFSAYINNVSAPYDLVFHGKKDNHLDPNWITIGTPEGTVFYIDDDATDFHACFRIENNKNLYVRGSIVTTTFFDLRSYRTGYRRESLRNRAVNTDHTAPTAYDHLVTDGAQEVIIDVKNYENPAILAKYGVWIIDRTHNTTIKGLVMAPYFDQIMMQPDPDSLSKLPKVYFDNPDYRGLVSVHGGVIGMIVELNHWFQISYSHSVQDFAGFVDRTPVELKILKLEKDFHPSGS